MTSVLLTAPCGPSASWSEFDEVKLLSTVSKVSLSFSPLSPLSLLLDARPTVTLGSPRTPSRKPRHSSSLPPLLVASSSRSSQQMSSESETDAFFTHANRSFIQPAPTSTRPSKRRKSAHNSDSDSSSDLEILSSVKKTSTKAAAGAAKKGKGKEKLAAPRPLKTVVNTVASKGKGKKTKGSEVLLSSSGSSEDEDGQGPSSTQLEEGGDALRRLARERAGWQGSTPQRRTKQRAEQSAKERREREEEELRREMESPRSEDEDDSSRSRRRTSASTAQTSFTDRSSSAVKKKAPTAKKPAAPKAKSTTTTKTRKRRSSPPPVDRSPSPVEQPPAPEDFWGVQSHELGGERLAKKKAHGEASKKLKTLSEQRSALVLPDDEGEDEIAGSSSGSEGPGRYETVAAKAKRQKEEALGALRPHPSSPRHLLTLCVLSAARLKSKRGQAKLPLQPAPNGNTPLASPRKGKGRAMETCLVCGQQVRLFFSLSTLHHLTVLIPTVQVAATERERHDAACFAGGATLDLSDSQLDYPSAAAAAPPPARRPPPSRTATASTSTSTSAFRPAGAAAARAPPTASISRKQADPLAAQLFPSASPPVARKAPPAAAAPAKGKGKAAAKPPGRKRSNTLVDDSDLEDDVPGDGLGRRPAVVTGFEAGGRVAPPPPPPQAARRAPPARAPPPPPPPQDDDDEYGQDGFPDDDGEWEDPAAFAALDKTVIDLVDEDDDEDEVVIAGPSRGAGMGGRGRAAAGAGGRGSARGRGDGATGAVNSDRRPGPPVNGSSPPKGSMFVSTMSREWKLGCASSLSPRYRFVNKLTPSLSPQTITCTPAAEMTTTTKTTKRRGSTRSHRKR